ncbi:ATP-binding protein, partial [Desulfosarcina sp. OttesenSCG-928-A07]|nr:ATP-binding protein [Desulfosarcina sp. OttesenSCG-928-A07]
RSASEEPGTFFKVTPPPLVVDEIQYAPGLFPYIKMITDAGGGKGQFFLSGSQQFQMMKNVSESLAGRIGILTLMGLSLREIKGITCFTPFIPTENYLNGRKQRLASVSYPEVWKIIHRGSMPAMYTGDAMDWQMFYAAYTKTYIERDVRELTQVGDEVKFLNFMTSIAASSGQLLNLASTSRDVGISQPTVERWLGILRASNLVFLLQPFHTNVTKRAVKTPKIYFMDTGLAAYLTRWNTPEVLQNGAMAGAFFETFVVGEVIKSYANSGILDPPLYFYRDKEQHEIDLLIQEGTTLHPIEIKKSADPDPRDISAFGLLDKIPGIQRGSGGMICMYDQLVPLKGEDRVIPISCL